LAAGTSRFVYHRPPGRVARQGNPVYVRYPLRQHVSHLVRELLADYSPRAVSRFLLRLLMLVSLALTFVVAAAAGAQDAPPTIRLVDGDVPIGPASVDTPSGERIGRLALANHFL